MKRFIRHGGFVLIALFISLVLIMAELTTYRDQTLGPVTCTFVKFDKSNRDIKMILKCGDKEYRSSDPELIIYHLENPDKIISGMLKRSDWVVKVEK
jgi:hypothetical protein